MSNDQVVEIVVLVILLFLYGLAGFVVVRNWRSLERWLNARRTLAPALLTIAGALATISGAVMVVGHGSKPIGLASIVIGLPAVVGWGLQYIRVRRSDRGA